MKILGILKSNRGHQQLDYLIKISFPQARALKKLLNRSKVDKKSEHQLRGIRAQLLAEINKVK